MTFLVTTCYVLFLLGAAIAFGGTAALSFAVAPKLFKTIPQEMAEDVFGKILTRFDAIAFVATVVGTIGGFLCVVFTGVMLPMILASSLLLGVAVLYGYLRKGLVPAMEKVGPPTEEQGGREAWAEADRAKFGSHAAVKLAQSGSPPGEPLLGMPC